MATATSALEKPKVMVALDFGTTYSGFVFAHTTDPTKIYSCYDYRNPGSEVSPGAVALAFHPELVVSRICKRTYGFAIREHLETGDPGEYLVTSDGYAQCRNRFRILVRKGDEVRVDDCVSTTCTASWKSTATATFRLFSCEDTDPRYTTADSVKDEGAFCVADVSGVESLSKASDDAGVALLRRRFDCRESRGCEFSCG